jgi:hypothetical protein
MMFYSVRLGIEPSNPPVVPILSDNITTKLRSRWDTDGGSMEETGRRRVTKEGSHLLHACCDGTCYNLQVEYQLPND